MTNRKKPDFARKAEFKVSKAAIEQYEKEKKKKPKLTHTPPIGFGVDPDFLPDGVRTWLEVHAAKSGLSAEQQGMLIAHANHLAQMPEGSSTPIGPQRKELKGVAESAHKLLNTLNALRGSTAATLTLHSREACVIERPCPLPLEVAEKLLSLEAPNLLDEVWDWVTALEAAANYTVEELKPSKTGKPSEALPRGLVGNLAAFYIRMTGTEPPRNNASWFAKFARTLGAHMGVHFEDAHARKIKGKPFIGEGIIETGIDLAMSRMPEETEQAEALKDRERTRATVLARLQASEWARDDKATLGILWFTAVGRHITAAMVATWSDEQVREVEAYCLALHTRAIAAEGPKTRAKVPLRPEVLRPSPPGPSDR